MTDAMSAWVDELATDAQLLGAELDTDYRVFAVTLESPWLRERGVEDARVQITAHPVAQFAAWLIRDDDGVVERFGVDLLPDVVHALGEPPLTVQPVAAGASAPPSAPSSLEGQSSALDGRSGTLHVEARGRARSLTIRVSFDVLEVRGPDGQVLAPPSAPDGPSAHG